MVGTVRALLPAPVRRWARSTVVPRFDGRLRVRTEHGVVLHGDLAHWRYLASLRLRTSHCELSMQRLFRAHVTGGRDVVDVGAYLGTYALTAAVAGDAGRVWAFEPHPNMHRLLQRNVAANGARVAVAVARDAVERVAVERVAVSDRHGTAALRLAGPEASRSMLAADGEVEVATTTLDAALGPAGADADVGVVKVDVEGHEVAVLEGARGLIERCRPTLFVEHHDASLQAHGRSSAELLTLLDELGYEVQVIDEPRRRLVAPTSEVLAGGHVNLLCLPRPSRRAG